MAERRDALSFAKTKEELLEVKINILREFEQIYEYDKLYSKIPEPFGIFNSEEEKKAFSERHLLINDFHFYLGNIFLSYHEDLLDIKHCFPAIRGLENIIDYESLYNHVIENYARALKNKPAPTFFLFPKNQNVPKNIKIVVQGDRVVSQEYPYQNSLNNVRKVPHAYSATFILPALIESSLLSNVDRNIQYLFYKSIQELKMKGEPISMEEERICVSFREAIQFKNIVIEKWSKEQACELMWNIGCERGIFNKNQVELKAILLNKTNKNKPVTLGWLLRSQYIKELIHPEYLTLMINLFDAKKINIRNSIMHGHSADFDYLSLGFVAVMLQLFWDITYGDAFKTKIIL